MCIYIINLYYSLFVRLGEFDESTESDCRLLEGRWTCAPPVLDIAAEKVILHESFLPRSFTNDIGLIKLARDVELSG